MFVTLLSKYAAVLRRVAPKKEDVDINNMKSDCFKHLSLIKG